MGGIRGVWVAALAAHTGRISGGQVGLKSRGLVMVKLAVPVQSTPTDVQQKRWFHRDVHGTIMHNVNGCIVCILCGV